MRLASPLRLLFSAACLMLAACTTSQTSPDENGPGESWTYTDARLGYSLEFPGSWARYADTSWDFLAADARRDAFVSADHVSGRSADPRPLLDLVAETVEKIRQRQGIESAIMPAEARGGDTVIPTISFVDYDGVSYSRITFFFDRGDDLGYVRFEAPNPGFDDSELDSIRASFTFP